MSSSFLANQGTQSPLLVDTTGGTGGTLIAVQKVDISPIGTAGTIWNGNVGVTSGTLNSIPNIPGGTINLGTVTVTNPTGTTVQFNNGTLNVGTVVMPSGTLTSIPNIPGGTLGSMLGVGSVSGLSNLPGGTLNNVGTVPGIGTVTNIGSIGNVGTANVVGTVSVNELSGTINLGTVAISSGTINQLNNIGTLPNLPGGTLNLVTTVSNLTNGSVAVTAGTIGTVLSLGTLPNLPGGTLNLVTTVTNLTNGTIQNSGTVTGVGVVSVLSKGTISLGSIGGIDVNAAAQTANPVSIGGTDSGGTVRTIKVDSGGLQRMGLDSGTISVLPNLPQGSINVTAGTIATLGTMGTLGTLVNQGSLTNVGQVYNAGTVQSLLGGSVVVTLGTIGTINNFSVPTFNATGGSIAGTQTSLVSGAPIFASDGGNWYALQLMADADALGQTGNVLRVGATGRVFNGSTWDRARGDATNGAYANVKALSANTAAVAPSISYQSALTNTKTQIKLGAGNLYGWHIYNPNNAVTYIQIYNKGTANIAVGGTAADWVLVVPQQGWLDDPWSSVPIWSFGSFSVAATTTAAGSTAPSSNLLANFMYI